MFRFFSRSVAVTFIDDETSAHIARSNVPVDQLPDTFALDTELEMEGVRYIVVRAEPQTKAEFARTKRLRVRLRRVELRDPTSLLFAIPTICGAALPASTALDGAANVIVLHEDDWRQCEFVADILHEDISAELSSVRRIHAVAAVGAAWREVHVRKRIGRPLPSGVTWAAVAEQIARFERTGGVAFRDSTSAWRVLGAVAARLPENVIVWGVEEAGELTALCVENIGGATQATVGALKRIADYFSLALIHWCSCRVYSSGSAPIAHALGAPWSDLV